MSKTVLLKMFSSIQSKLNLKKNYDNKVWLIFVMCVVQRKIMHCDNIVFSAYDG